MKTGLLFLLLPWSALHAQVHVGTAIHVTGDSNRLNGLAAPTAESAAITVDVLASGMVHWASATQVAGNVWLTLEPNVGTLEDGLLIRFLAPVDNAGPVTITLAGHPALPLIRTDGGELPPNALRASNVAEVLFASGRWVLLNPNGRNCPAGSIAVAANLCMEVDPFPGLRFYQAVDRCAQRGGRLCNWDEYAVGCALGDGRLNGMFNEWEWIDGSSNHTHSVNQAGRFSCESQRSANAVTLMTGNTRCCYRTR